VTVLPGTCVAPRSPTQARFAGIMIFLSVMFALSLFLPTCLDVNESSVESHRFMTLPMFVFPLVALTWLPYTVNCREDFGAELGIEPRPHYGAPAFDDLHTNMLSPDKPWLVSCSVERKRGSDIITGSVLALAAVAEDSSFLQLVNTSKADIKIKLPRIA